jgi:hypothetical protein
MKLQFSATRLQDDCPRRGEKILRDSVIGSALSQEQVSRYNPVTNKCYVRLEAWRCALLILMTGTNMTTQRTSRIDRETGELLAFLTVQPGGARACLGFGCDNDGCVSEKIAACPSDKECEPG